MRIVLFGAPGVGKGTQGKLIAEQYGFPVIATGDMLRAAVEAKSDLGLKAHEYMSRGDLVPDDVIIGVVEERLSQEDAARGFLLDGFPRTVAQAEALDEMLAKNGWPLDAVIALEVGEEALVARLAGRSTCPSCGAIYHSASARPNAEGVCDNCGHTLTVREDDRPEAVRQRLAVYREKTAPVIEYYNRDGRLLIVDGTMSRGEVTTAIEEALA